MTSERRPFDAYEPLAMGTTMLEASAGTGKTHAITSLVVRLVACEGLPLSEVLTVTFTEAATAELKARIRDRLASARRVFEGGDPGDDDFLRRLYDEDEDRARALRRLEAALAGFDEATISTIHAFCHRVLAEHAFESGVTFDTELLTDLRPLIADVVQDVWTRATLNASRGWFEANKSMKSDSIEPFTSVVWRARDIELRPHVEEAASRWQALVAEVQALGPEQHAEAIGAVAAAVDAGWMHKSRFVRPFPGRRAVLEAWLVAGRSSWMDRPVDLGHFTSTNLETLTNAKFKKDAPRHRLFDLIEQLAEIAPALEVGFRQGLVRDLRAEIDARLRARGAWSFDDLLQALRRSLDGEGGDALVARLRSRYRAVLIDEFQDTDAVQWEIFSRAFAREDGWLCLIGDPKQAIYGFRGGDIYTYLAAGEAASDQATLSRNWRSDARLVRAVNTVFNVRDAPFLDPRVRFDAVDARHEERMTIAGEPGPAFRIVFRGAPEGTAKAPAPGAFTEELPELVATEIVTMLTDERVKIEGEELAPRHLCVLTRNNKQAREVQSALAKRRVPSILHGDASVFSTPEAVQLRRVLEAVLEPARETTVKGALATDLLGLDAAEIDSLGEEGEGEKRWIRLLDDLRQLRIRWDEVGFVPMVHRLFASRRVSERALGQLGGERRQTNLVHLVEVLHRASREERLGPAALVRWLRRQIEREREGKYTDREAAQIRLESDADAVQIATIHRAKGLEYPVVFCPWLWSPPSRRSQWYVEIHDPSENDRHVLDVLAEGKAKQRKETENREEELRLAYVALTRAKHLCVVHHAWVKDVEKSPLGHLLHEHMAVDEAVMRADLEELEVAGEGTIQVADRGESSERRLPRADATTPTPAARRLERPLDLLFRTSSFTALVRDRKLTAGSPTERGAERDDPAADAPAIAGAGAKIVLEDFVRGARAGTFLHRVLELADFRPEARAALVSEVERQRRFSSIPESMPSEAIADGLARALDAPIEAAGVRLADVAPTSRFNELPFLFPVRHGEGKGSKLTARALAEAVRAHGGSAFSEDVADRIGALGFTPLRGFMRGFVDLVFAVGRGADRRFFVVDFKSNYLGARYDDYGPGALRDAMREHDYDLQALLYTVAVHRFLGARVPGYDPVRHFGGVLYLFLRGMSADHPGRGVVSLQPPPALIDALDRTLATAGEER